MVPAPTDELDEPADPLIGQLIQERYRILERLAHAGIGAGPGRAKH